eukprot:m.180263 g.180263  ORF g.180263 m.180263 type:complete len:224 (+) comp14958_c0_seq1:121-792(+)
MGDAVDLDAEMEALYLDPALCDESRPQDKTHAATLIKAFAKDAAHLYDQPEGGSGQWHDLIADRLGLRREKWYYGPTPREKAERLVLDQIFGRFLVRVSIKKPKQSYAITVAMGKLQFLHIAVPCMPDGTVQVDGVSFPDVRAVVNHFSSHTYKGMVKLAGPIVPKPLSKRPLFNTTSSTTSCTDDPEDIPPAPPPRPSLESETDDLAPPPPPRPSLGALNLN